MNTCTRKSRWKLNANLYNSQQVPYVCMLYVSRSRQVGKQVS